MIELAQKNSIGLDELLEGYDHASWLGYLHKTEDGVKYGQWTVGRAKERNYAGIEDMYISYNPLRGYVPRSKANVGKLSWLYVDLDIGRGDNPFEDDTTREYKQSLIRYFEENIFGVTVPAPSYICDSGRGLYLIYVIKQSETTNTHEHVNAVERWRRVNTYLTSQFREYCADCSVSTDEARVLRVPGSVNSHTGREVQYYRYSDKTYTLYNIERDYMSAPTQAQLHKLERVEALLGVSCTVRNKRSIRRFLERHEEEYKKARNKAKPSEKQLKYAEDIARVLELELPRFRTAGGASRYIQKHHEAFLAEKAKRKNHRTSSDGENTSKMLEKRLQKLERVLVDAPEDSYREKGLFLYRMFACEHTGDKKLAAEMTRELLGKMACPIPEREAMQETRSAEKYWESGRAYKLKDETLAEWLGLSAEEWKELLPRVSYDQDKELKRARNRRHYKKKLERTGDTTKQEKIKARRESIARLIGDGKTKEEICSELQISERTYYADKKYLQDEKEIESNAKKSDAKSNKGPLGPCRPEEMETEVSHTSHTAQKKEHTKEKLCGWIDLLWSQSALRPGHSRCIVWDTG